MKSNVKLSTGGERMLLRLVFSLLTTTGLCLSTLHAEGDKSCLMADTWVATDALGRVMPTSHDYALRTDKPRTVGIFYITWHTQGLHNGRPYRSDVTRVLNEDPTARTQWDNKAWDGGSYHWGEPEYGYFLSRDRYVVRHDLSMLADAGVDVLILDVTNAVHYWDEWEVLFQEMDEMRRLGNDVPRFCFWAFNGPVTNVVQQLYDRYYKTNRYRDSWFIWQGKPLLLYNANPNVDANHTGGGMDKNDYSPEVKQFFTLRNMWWGYYEWAGKRFVGTEDNWSFGLDLGDKRVAAMTPQELCAKHNGRLEEFAVTPAQHPISIIGKSWTRKDGEPKLNEYDMPERAYVPWLQKEKDSPVQYGIYFQDRWEECLEADPDFVYLNDWNEWTAGRYRSGIDPSGQLPGPTTFLGRENPFYFVDQYNAEFCRTIAPMKGGFTDNYYMQMVQNIRRYKGVSELPEGRGFSRISIDGDFEDWQDVEPTYRDTQGDVIHRDHDGYGDLHYTDQSGRNDIVLCKVAVDKENIYFYCETAEPLTEPQYQGQGALLDTGWMTLFIDGDSNHQTGWQGFDVEVGGIHKQNRQQCYIRRNRPDGRLTESFGTLGNNPSDEFARVSWQGNRLELAIPRKTLGLTGNELSLDFKWSDNAQGCDIISLATTGDTAPNRRFCYRFQWRQ